MKELNETQIKELLDKAYDNAKGAYAPYSNFKVGAVLGAKSGNQYNGINIENRAYPSGTCAERSAIFSAVVKGDKEFDYVVIASTDAEEILSPCGGCRQVMAEFFDDDTTIVMSNKNKEYTVKKMKDILPMSPLDELTR